MKETEFYLKDLKSRFPRNGEDFYLSYSGGRDSHFLYWFIKNYLHDDKIEIVSINTYMEHPQILKRMQENADIILLPRLKPYDIKRLYGSPCFSKTQDQIIDRYQRGIRSKSTMERVMGTDDQGNSWGRFALSKKARNMLLDGQLHRISDKCCKYLKKETAKEFEKLTGKKKILAVRGDESALRTQQYKTCFSKDGSFHPLYDLTDGLLRQIEKDYDIEIPSIYNYTTRTGCMGCPYGSYKHDTENELRLVTKAQRRFLGEYFKESYKVLGIDVNKIKQECGDFENAL